jgi:hypothetical protein
MLSLLSGAVHKATNILCLWEEINRVVCSVAMDCLGEFFEKLDQELVKEYTEKKGWRLENKETRTIMTPYGPVSFTRHFMYDTKGKGQYPLDKVLGIVPYMRVSPDIWGKVVRIATSPGMTYRLTSEVLNVLTGASISHTTVKNFVDKAGASQEAIDQQERSMLFEEGEIPKESPNVDQLFVEYDGLYVKGIDGNIEIKNKVSYTGWGEDGKRRNLENRRVFSSVEAAEDFMEGSYVDICSHHNIEASEIIVNGDGAQWIGNHLESLFVRNKVIRQLDPFHVKRAIQRGLRKQPELMLELEKAIKARNRKKAEIVIETSLGNTGCPREKKEYKI